MISIIKKCGICALFAFMFISIAEAQNVLKVVVTQNNVDICSAPNSKERKVHVQSYSGETFLVSSVPVRDKSDKSRWYKILFIINEGHSRIIQPQKLPAYDYSHPYINAKFVKKEKLNEDDKEALNYFKLGRPINIRVGDDLSAYSLPTQSHTLKTDITLRKEPKAKTSTTTLPAGTVVLVCIDHFGMYYDLDETCWFYLMDKDQKLIGWETSEYLAPVFDWQE